MPFLVRAFPISVMLGITAFLAVSGCSQTDQPWPEKAGPKVAVSFPPLYSFALNVAGDDASIRSIMTSQGPHHFDPKPSDHRLLHGADAFLINGLTLDDPIAPLMKNGSGNRELKIINLGDSIDKSLLLKGFEHVHDDGEGHRHVHSHAVDPHIWLGLDLAEMQVNAIRDALKSLAPDRAAHYDRNAAEYNAKLQKLHAEGRAAFQNKANRRFVTFHASLAYFARSFDLEIAAVIESIPGKEPTGTELQNIVDTCLKNHVRVIAVEPQYTSQAAAKRILGELTRKGIPDAVLVEIDPLETAQESDLSAEWYENKMRANIDALAKALK